MRIAVPLIAAVFSAVQISAQGPITQPYGDPRTYPVVAPVVVSPPAIATPVTHLATIPPPAGATAAAPGQQIGATSSPSLRMVQPVVPTISPQFLNTPSYLPLSTPEDTSVYLAEQDLRAQELTAPSQRTPERREFDFGAAPLGWRDESVDKRSVAEIAAAYQRSRQQQVSRSYTNRDIEQMNQQTQQSATAIFEDPAQGTSGGTEPKPRNNMQIPGAAPPMATARENATIAQIRSQPSQTSVVEGAQTSSQQQLPATASFLPLVAIFGLLTAGTGLLLRR